MLRSAHSAQKKREGTRIIEPGGVPMQETVAHIVSVKKHQQATLAPSLRYSVEWRPYLWLRPVKCALGEPSRFAGKRLLVEWVNQAAVIWESGPVRLICDPRIEGRALALSVFSCADRCGVSS